jgi:hypothetical protein
MATLDDVTAAAKDYATAQYNAGMADQKTIDDASITSLTGQMQSDGALIASLQSQLAAASAPPAASVKSRYGKLVLNQDFSKMTALDPAVWNVEPNLQRTNEQGCSRAQNVFIRDGQLVMRAVRESFQANGKTYDFSGAKTTTGKQSTGTQNPVRWLNKGGYGLYEVRALVPLTLVNSAGIWPCPLWLRCQNSNLEIDITEGWGEPITGTPGWRFPAGSMQHTVIADTNSGSPKWGYVIPAPKGARLADSPHTWACELSPDGITLWQDGVQLNQFTTAAMKAKGIDYVGLMGDINLRVDMQVGQLNYNGPTNADTKSPAEMLIDHIRVWN